jgi:hypothetical protein
MVMVFDKNQIIFKDCIQEKVWELGTNLLPLDMTLPYVPAEYKSACEDLYYFTYSILTDMYENPDEFGFAIDLSKQDYENKKQVEFYFWFIGWLKNLSGNQYEVASENFKKITKKFNPISVERLKAHGFMFEYKSDMVVIRNDIYPDMFIAAEAIIASGYANYKVNRGHFMLCCDYRAFAKYKRTYEDLHFVFSDNIRKIAEQLHAYNVSQKVMPQKCNYFYRVEYKKKGKIVYISNLTSKNKLRIYIGFAELNGEAYKMIENEIHHYEYCEEIAEFCRNNLKKCTNCTPNCGKKGKTTEIFGKNTFVCQPYIRISDPSEQDLKHIFKLIDLRVMLINAGISEEFYPGNG